MNDVVRNEIENLRKEKTKALKARYRELFGEESHSSNHVHLFRRIAWRLQALVEGDLSERARQSGRTGRRRRHPAARAAAVLGRAGPNRSNNITRQPVAA